MANESFTHRGYSGSIEISSEDRCLHGQLLFINDIVTYEGETYSEIETAFKAAVDRYLDYCKRTGKTPGKAYSGSFNIRVGIERHRLLARQAYAQGVKINEAVCTALDAWLKPIDANHTHNHIHLHVENYRQIEPHVITSSTMQTYQVAPHVHH